MPATLELGVQEGVHNPLGQIIADDAGAHGQHIGIVVAAGHLCGEGITAQGTADPMHFICGDGHADACGADHDALFALAGGHRLCCGAGEVGVVAALLATGTEILYFVARGGQIGLDVLFQSKSAVIGSDGDHHGYSSQSLYTI